MRYTESSIIKGLLSLPIIPLGLLLLFAAPVKASSFTTGNIAVYSNILAPAPDTTTLQYPIPSDEDLQNSSPLFMSTPQNITTEVEYDPKTKQYTIYYKVGNVNIRTPRVMSENEYRQFQFEQSMRNYWQQKQKGETSSRGSGILPRLQVGGETFDRIFGSNVIEIIPQGSAELVFGITSSNTKNYQIAEDLRKNTTFDFQSKIQMNVNGTVGEKLRMEVSYNTEATFDFENNVKLEYTGFEDEIIQKIEAGNVSMPLPGSLITGSHSLFGLKTQLRFGRLTVTSIFSKQNSQSQVMEVSGGAQSKEFDIQADEYEANKHFFLSHYFRDTYNQSLQNLPIVNSGVNITRIEVWMTNKRNNFEETRDMIAFHDLGENQQNIYSTNNFSQQIGGFNQSPGNQVNDLYEKMTNVYSGIRNISDATQILSGLANFNGGVDYAKLGNARKLSQSEYTLNAQLGYISINTSLNGDEILAVAYEYTMGGKTYKVGEFSTDGITSPSALIVKLLKGTNLSPRLPTWNLMMKNIYSMNTYQINKTDFNLNILYQNDQTGTSINYLPEGNIANEPLLAVLNLDNLNSNLDPGSDGMFDFIEGITINSANGRVIFPVLEPFGKDLAKKIGDPDLVERYVYQELYDSTQTKARQNAEKNKFSITGTYQSSSSSEIPLNAVNVPRGSVVVTAGGVKLIEGSDYTVDYIMGSVKIINPAYMESNTPIQISLESQDMFNLQSKTLVGSHFDYKFSDNFNIGATVLNLTERPLTQKVNYGNEAVSNTIWGLNTSYQTESGFLTKAVDFLPFIETKEKSTITFDAEFAQFIPGHSRAVGKDGTVYIDDFEGSKSSIDIRSEYAWSIASVPQHQPSSFPNAHLSNDLKYGFDRALMAWYTIDPLFLRNNSLTPDHIRKDKNTQSNHFVREIYEREIFPNRNTPQGMPTNMAILNLAYYPNERGPYNYNTNNINEDGFFENPNNMWAGITRPIPSPDFEAANTEYIEFWLMDPFVHDSLHTGGDFYINLGEISEDILKDGKRAFESGLPISEEVTNIETTAWGRVPTVLSLSNVFNTDANTRRFQDVGLDGLRDVDEQLFFEDYLEALKLKFGETSQVYIDALKDPSNDNFRYYQSTIYDSNETGILDRYKRFNMPEGNSTPEGQPTPDGIIEPYTNSITSIPDGEDINDDSNLNEDEMYYQYRISLRPQDFEVGSNFITDKVNYKGKFANDKPFDVNWYQFKIPINEYEGVYGGIQDFKSIRFIRMFLKDFSDTIILRFATLELVRGEWRRYNRSLIQGQEGMPTTDMPEGNLEVSVVNIEENNKRTPVNYVLPPGVDRVIDPSQPQLTELNEQAMEIKVTDLADGDARAVFKSVNIDIRQYRKMMMDIHAEEILGYPLKDEDLSVFVRLGTDYSNNFYEYEIPLVLTPPGHYSNNRERDRRMVWPKENEMDIDLELFTNAKLLRNDEMRKAGSLITYSTVFTVEDGNRKIRITGNPSLSNVKVLMIGVRNAKSSDNPNDNGYAKSGIIWVNELRLSQSDDKGGWAANARVAAKLADLGMVTVSGTTIKPGFGSIEKKVNERSLEDFYQYDINSTIQLGRFFPKESGVNIPLFIGFSESFANPEYNPIDPDIKLRESIERATSKEERDTIKKISQDYTRRKSLNLTNVRINKIDGQPKIYSISNFAVSYSYNEQLSRNITTEERIQRNVRGGLTYTYNTKPKSVVPLRKVKAKWLSNPYLRIVKDFNFNYMPNQFSFRTELNRTYFEQQLRNLNNPEYSLLPTYSKDFHWNRVYSLNWDISQAIKFDFNANNQARIDEPLGIVNKSKDPELYEHWRDTVWTNLKNFGRNTNYNHQFNLSYNIPINKLPPFNWVTASARYTGSFNWQTGPVLPDTSRFDPGNTIQNANTIQLTSQLNLTSLYNKSKFLKGINQKFDQRGRGVTPKKTFKTVTYEQTGLRLRPNFARSVTHNLKTEDVKVKAFDAEGKEIDFELNIRSDKRVTIRTDKDLEDVRVVVEGQIPERENIALFLLEGTVRILMGVKNISGSFSQTNGTLMPGYKPNTQFLGMEKNQNVFAPGFPFVAGWQDPDFAWKAVRNNWLTTDSTINAAFMLSRNENITLRSTIEPLPNLRIELNALRSQTKNKNEYYLANEFGVFNSYNPMATGNFSISIISIHSLFERSTSKNNYISDVFEQFKANRLVIANRLSENRDNFKDALLPVDDEEARRFPYGYGALSQDVLFYSFLSAYTGVSPDKIKLTQFPLIPMPNWQITYDGLSKLKPFRKILRNFTIRHGYRSTFSIGAFASNLDYNPGDDGLSYIEDLNRNYVPELEVSNISVNEQFNPLFSLDATWTNSLTNRVEVRNSRTIAMSFANNQVSENKNWEFIVGSGYRFENLPLIFGSASGGSRTLKSDLRVNVDFSLRNNYTILRKIVENTNTHSAGQNILSIKTSAEYVVSDQVTIRLFFDRVVNTPLVSNSYATANTSFGFSLRFTMIQ
ncbi:MAG: cell surface protein SprA [Bacteroidales bacterium]|nr:cell surface protein SprA [Bacteroidales bacterium]